MKECMILCERHIISKNHKFYNECDNLTFLAKNLYNATLYYQRESFFNKEFKNYYDVNRFFTHSNQNDYRALPAKVAKQVQMLVDKAFKSYFSVLKKKVAGDYEKSVNIPGYLNTTRGRCTVPYPKDALSLKNDGFIKLSQTSIVIKTKVPKNNVQGARIVPKGNHFVIEVLYKVASGPLRSDKPERVAFIDQV